MSSFLLTLLLLSMRALSYCVLCSDKVKVKLHVSNVITLNSPLYMKKVEIDIPPSFYRYIMVQATSQLNVVSMSYSNSSKYGQFMNATSVGLIYMLQGGENSINAYLAAPKHPTSVQLQAIPYSLKDPVPGGCCTTCSFDNDPNIIAMKEASRIKIVFSRANVFHNPGSPAESCDGGKFSTFQLQYDLYTYQLDENDLSISGLYKGIWKMSSVARIKFYGKKIGTKQGTSKVQFSLQYIAYQDFVYNIIVRDPSLQTVAAYNPHFSYGCDIADKETCKSFGSLTTIIYVIFIGVIGLALCFFGHKFFRIELFISGSVTGFILVYILMLRFGSMEYTGIMLIATAVAIIAGLTLVLLWMKTSFFYLCLLNNNALIGFLVSCSILSSPLGEMEVFSSNLVYILTLLCIALVFPIPLVFFPKLSSIIFSCFYGGFAVVLTCSVFLHANLQYIVVEFLLRAGIPSFADAYLRVSFQRNDYILCCVWAILIVSGGITQYVVTRTEKFPPLYKLTKKNGRKSRRKIKRITDERTPLLQGENIQYGVVLTPSKPNDITA